MNILVGQFFHIGIGQSRKTAEYEYVPNDGGFVVGELRIHDCLQFRFRKKTAVTVSDVEMKPGERIGSDPAVPESRIGH